MTDIEKASDSVRAVDRALDVLLAFAPTDGALTAGELLKRLDLSRPTLYRLLRTLENNGFVESGGEPQRFRLGPAVAQLAHVWTAGLDLVETARPIMRRLWQETGETVSLLVPQGQARRCVAEMPSPQALSFRCGVGYEELLERGASGKVILAHERDAAFVAARVGKSAALAQELAAIRERGYAVSNEELISGAVAIAAPVFNGADTVAGSLAVFGPSVRLTPARIAAVGELLMGEARELSLALGHG